VSQVIKSLRVNEQIRITPIRVIDHEQRQLGVIPTHEAMKIAREAGLDLVEVSPQERPPVCRIMDYGKYKYERKKRQKVAAAGHVVELKEIRLRPKTDTHDREIKVKHARDFLAEGHKVQFTMLFKGRERAHRDIAQEIFDEILKSLGENVRLERGAAMDGRRMTMIVAPGPGKSQSSAPSGTAAAPPKPPPPAPVFQPAVPATLDDAAS
jgi:translation initiation factor IF-3